MSNLPTFPTEDRKTAERIRAKREGREPDLENPPPYVGDFVDFEQGEDVPVPNEPATADAKDDAKTLGLDEDEDYDPIRDEVDKEREENTPNVAETTELDEVEGDNDDEFFGDTEGR